MTGSFDAMRSALLDFVESAVGDADQVSLVAFADEVRNVAEAKAEVLQALRTLPAVLEGGARPTAFFASLDRALDRFANAPSRAALLVASDACDSTDESGGGARVAARAGEMAIPTILLSPGRGECRRTSCSPMGRGRWKPTEERPPEIGDWITSPSIESRPTQEPETYRVSSAGRSTSERDRFLGLTRAAGGSLLVARSPDEWRAALVKTGAALSEQWTVVYEPSGDEVRSAEVRLYRIVDGQRRRVR